MAKQCEHIKANGQQCRGAAIWGSEPPRCAIHRLDGGPLAPTFEAGNQLSRRGLKHGYYSRGPGGRPTLEKKVARCLLTHSRLLGLLNHQDDPRRLLHYFRLFGRNLERLLRLLAEYEQASGQHPDRLLEKAAGEPLAALLAELKAGRHVVKRDYANTRRRSPRYWLVYQAIVDHIRDYRVGPTHRNLRNACGIRSKRDVAYWLDRLEADGLIIRRPGRNGIDLPDDPAGPHPPRQPEGRHPTTPTRG